ncbi:hypothetical protein AAHE18_20G144900 [Arachis hypogaea]
MLKPKGKVPRRGGRGGWALVRAEREEKGRRKRKKKEERKIGWRPAVVVVAAKLRRGRGTRWVLDLRRSRGMAMVAVLRRRLVEVCGGDLKRSGEKGSERETLEGGSSGS